MRRFNSILIMACIAVSLSACEDQQPEKDALYDAIISEDTERVRELSSDTHLINSPHFDGVAGRIMDANNRYPLEVACGTSHEMAQILLDAGANVNAIDPTIHSTALITALSANYPERFQVAEALIEHGADIDIVDDNRRTALNLCTCAFSGDTEETAKRQQALLQYLLDQCDIGYVVAESKTNPLIEAAKNNNTAVIDIIIQDGSVGIDDMPNGYTALMSAAGMGQKEACRLLMEYGADPYMLSSEWMSAYDYAVEYGDQELIDLFAQSK